MQRIEGLSISLDLDSTALNRGLTGLKDKLKTVNSEMKANMSAFDRGDRSVSKYETRLTGLNRKLEVQKEVTKAARTEYERIVQEHGEGSKEAEKAARAYNNQVAALNNLERYTERTREELERLREEQRIAESGWTRFGQSLESAGNRLTSIGDSMKNVGRNMSMYVTAPLLGLGGVATKTGMDFEEGMSKVSAISGATAEDLEKLEDQARELGATTQFSATQAAEAQQFLAMAGFKTNDILGAMPGMLDLAAAGALDLGRAADISSNILSAFTLEAAQSGHVSDVLAKAAANANTDVEQLGEAMKYLAPAANSLGWTLEDSTAAVMALGDAGIQGTLAGQAFASSLTRLAKPTRLMNKTLKNTGMEFFNAAGEMKSMPEIIKELEIGTKGMTQEQKAATIATLFGAEAYKHWAVLLEKGSKPLAKNKEMLEGADGAAKEMAKTMNDNAKGDIKTFKSALEELAIQVYDMVQPALRGIIQSLTQAVQWVQNLSPQLKLMTIIFAGVAAAIGPLLVVGGMFVGFLGNAALGLSRLFPAIAQAGGLLKWLRLGFVALTGPVGITIGILTALGAGFIALYKNSDGFRAGVHELIAKIKELAKNALTALQPAIAAVVKFFKDQLATIQKFWDENKDAIMGALNNIYKFIKFIFENGILPVIKFVMPLILAIIKSVWGNIQGVIKGALNIIMGAIKIFSGLFTGDFKKMWEGVKQLFKGGIEFAWNLFNLLFIGRLLKGIGTFVKSFVSFLKGGWDNAIGGIRTFVGKAKDWFRSFADDGLAKFNQLIDGAKALPVKIGNGIRSMAGKVSDGIRAVANKMAQGLGSGVNGVIGGVNWVLKKVGIKNLIPLWSIPQYATGTDNHPGGPAVVGEKGRELAHVPGVGYTMLGEQGAQFLNLPKGTSVLPNKETESLLSGMFPAYAKGTGWLSKAWDKTKKTAGKIKDKALDVWSYISDPSKLFNKALEMFGVEKPSFPGMLKDIGIGSFNKIKEALKGFLKSKIEDFGSDVPAAGSGVKRWSGVAARALMMTGQYSKANLDRLLYQMQTESGGNPRAINLWDINAKRGTPSKGLMQVIDPTFRAYAHPGFNKNVYDPLSNILASIRYAVSRYGSLAKAYRGVGYATGGLINQDGLYRLAEGGWPEFVIPTDPARRTDAMKLLALAGKQIQGNKRPNQLPSLNSGTDDNVLVKLLEATMEQTQVLLQLLNKDTDIYLEGSAVAKGIRKEVSKYQQQDKRVYSRNIKGKVR